MEHLINIKFGLTFDTFIYFIYFYTIILNTCIITLL